MHSYTLHTLHWASDRLGYLSSAVLGAGQEVSREVSHLQADKNEGLLMVSWTDVT